VSPATLHAVFNWDFVTAMTSASVAVIAVANTLASLALRAPGRFRVSRAWTAFIASMMLTIYAAWLGGWSWHPGRLAEIVAHGLVLFCVAAGLHESVFAVARRVPGGRGAAAAAGAGPAAAPAPGGGWWASWF
jgi:hypothetical protein